MYFQSTNITVENNLVIIAIIIGTIIIITSIMITKTTTVNFKSINDKTNNKTDNSNKFGLEKNTLLIIAWKESLIKKCY